MIEFCDGKICVVNLFEDEIFLELKTKNNNEKYCNGFLYNNKNNGEREYLCSCGWTVMFILSIWKKKFWKILLKQIFLMGLGI